MTVFQAASGGMLPIGYAAAPVCVPMARTGPSSRPEEDVTISDPMTLARAALPAHHSAISGS